jgi:hypothetical protein
VRALIAYGRRARIAVPVALAVFAVDQLAKLGAAAVHPSTYVLNPRTPSALGTAAVAVTMALVLTLPFRPALVASAIWAGGAAGNLFDAYLWPGGVPDFIRVSFIWGTWNPADAFIALGAFSLAVSLVAWLALGAIRPSPAV